MRLPSITISRNIFNLKVGCIVMGCINAALSFIFTCIMIPFALEAAALYDAVQREGITELQAIITALLVLAIVLIVLFIAKFIFDIVYVWGVATERGPVITAYNVMTVVVFLLSVFIVLLLLTMVVFSRNALIMDPRTTWGEMFYIALSVITILLSRSFYRQLNRRENI